MSADRDVTTRIVRSWLHEDAYEDADRILNLVLDEIDTTPQRRANWLARRFPPMNKYAQAAIVAVAVLAVAVVGYNLLPRSGGPGTQQSPSPSPSLSTQPSTSPGPAPLAAGTFSSHGGDVELEVTGDGPDVTGSMTYADQGGADLGGFVVDLNCTRETAGGLIFIGGPIIEATKGYAQNAPVGTNVALILQRGSPVTAEILIEYPDPHEPDCGTFLASIPDERPAGALEPIVGAVTLRP